MTAIAEFFDRLDQAADLQIDATLLVGDDVLEAAGEQMRPTFARRCERAGVSLDELQAAIADRTETAVSVSVARALLNYRLRDEVNVVTRGAGLFFFLAGVMWEQERHLPEITEEPTP
jgi:hypothetical protein